MRPQCLASALEWRRRWVWGGTSGRDRQGLKRIVARQHWADAYQHGEVIVTVSMSFHHALDISADTPASVGPRSVTAWGRSGAAGRRACPREVRLREAGAQ